MEIASLAAQNSAASTGAFSSLTKNFDTFLTLLTTQLRNQDPLDPLNTEKFTEQLVQFAGVEQSIKTNAHLEALIKLQAASDRDSAIGFVGKSVSVETDRAIFDGNTANWRYEPPAGAVSMSFAIVDDRGAVIARRMGSTAPGAQTLVWDGKKDNGATANAGVYRLAIDARDATGAQLETSIQSAVRVTAADFAEDGVKLETEIGLVPLEAVRRLTAGS